MNFFGEQPAEEQLETINNFLKVFLNEFNNKNTGKEINILSPLTKQTGSIYEIVGDFGVHNSIKTVRMLLKELSSVVKPGIISKVVVK